MLDSELTTCKLFSSQVTYSQLADSQLAGSHIADSLVADVWLAGSHFIITSEFSYCLLSWMRHYKRANNKSNHIFEKALRIVHQNKTSFERLKRQFNNCSPKKLINCSNLNCMESILGLPATSKMERFVIIVNGCFVIIVNGFQPLTIITKRSILDVVAVLDPPPITPPPEAAFHRYST